MDRKSSEKRKTSETDIKIKLELGSTKKSDISSGVPFFDHMLASMSKHGRFYIEVKCIGDLQIDDHHSIEDIGIVFGTVLKDALGEKKGIRRFGDATVPMDEALTMAAVDISGRPYFKYSGIELKGKINKYSEELTMEFLRSFATNAGINLHVNVIHGENRHHIHESIFKALGIALYKATSIDSSLDDIVMSTKGTLK